MYTKILSKESLGVRVCLSISHSTYIPCLGHGTGENPWYEWFHKRWVSECCPKCFSSSCPAVSLILRLFEVSTIVINDHCLFPKRDWSEFFWNFSLVSGMNGVPRMNRCRFSLQRKHRTVLISLLKDDSFQWCHWANSGWYYWEMDQWHAGKDLKYALRLPSGAVHECLMNTARSMCTKVFFHLDLTTFIKVHWFENKRVSSCWFHLDFKGCYHVGRMSWVWSRNHCYLHQ